MAASANLTKISSFVPHCADDGESRGLCLAFQFLGLFHTPLLIFDENAALKGPVISNANNQSGLISGGLNGLGRNIKRFCLLRCFLPQRLSLSSFVFVCQGRPHTGTAVTGSQSYFLRSCCQVNRHTSACACTHANRHSHADKQALNRPHLRFSERDIQPRYSGANIEQQPRPSCLLLCARGCIRFARVSGGGMGWDGVAAYWDPVLNTG